MVMHDLAVLDHPQHPTEGGSGEEIVFAGLQAARGPAHLGKKHEH